MHKEVSIRASCHTEITRFSPMCRYLIDYYWRPSNCEQYHTHRDAGITTVYLSLVVGDGHERIIVAGKILLIEIATRFIIDVLSDVLLD